MAKGKQKIRIKLKAYDVSLLDASARKIVETAKRSGAEVSGPIPLPVKNHLICVLRSPFIDKKSREHFHILTHKRVVDITKPTQNTVDALMGLELPSGVDAEIKTS